MNTNDKMQPTSSASSAEQVRALIANLAAVVRVQNGNQHYDINTLLSHADELLSSSIVPPVVQAPTDRQILDFASYAYNRGGLSVGFTDVAALDKFREIVGVAAPIVATVPSELPGIIVCEIGDYAPVMSQPMATVIYYDKKVAECYTNEDAALIGDALRSLYAAPISTAAEQASDVRNAALEECAVEAENAICDCCWEEAAREAADYIASQIRDLKSSTPADKGNASEEGKS